MLSKNLKSKMPINTASTKSGLAIFVLGVLIVGIVYIYLGEYIYGFGCIALFFFLASESTQYD